MFILSILYTSFSLNAAHARTTKVYMVPAVAMSACKHLWLLLCWILITFTYLACFLIFFISTFSLRLVDYQLCLTCRENKQLNWPMPTILAAKKSSAELQDLWKKWQETISFNSNYFIHDRFLKKYFYIRINLCHVSHFRRHKMFYLNPLHKKY